MLGIYIDYLVQLIEHPILRIPNILFVYFLRIFSIKKMKSKSKYNIKCQFNWLYHKERKKNILRNTLDWGN